METQEFQYNFSELDKTGIGAILRKQLLLLRKHTPLTGLSIYEDGQFHKGLTSVSFLKGLIKEFDFKKLMLYTTVMPYSITIPSSTGYFYVTECLRSIHIEDSGRNEREIVTIDTNSWREGGPQCGSRRTIDLHRGTMLVCL